MADMISSLKTADLVKVFNAVTGGSVKKFETRERGLGRVRAALDQAGMPVDQALRAAGLDCAPPAVAEPAVAEPAEVAPRLSRPDGPDGGQKNNNGVDEAVLELARQEPRRMADFMAEVPGLLGWDGVNRLTAKGRIRAAINRLVSAGRLTWTDKDAKGARHFTARS